MCRVSEGAKSEHTQWAWMRHPVSTKLIFLCMSLFFTKNFPLCMGSSDYSKKATPQENQLFGKMGRFWAFMFYIIPKYQKIPKSTEHVTFRYQIKAGCYLRNHQTTWEWNLFLKSQFYIHTGSTIRNWHKVKTWLD